MGGSEITPPGPRRQVQKYSHNAVSPEQAMLDRMAAMKWQRGNPELKPGEAPRLPPSPKVIRDAKWHETATKKMLEMSQGKWVSIGDFMKALDCPLNVARHKITKLTGTGELKGKGRSATRLFTRGSKEAITVSTSKRRKTAQRRRDKVCAAITEPMKLKDIVKKTGIVRSLVGLDLRWLEEHERIEVSRKAGVAAPSIYSPRKQPSPESGA